MKKYATLTLNTFEKEASKLIKDYELNDVEKATVTDIVCNMLRLYEANLSIDKGIMLAGNVGVGKTMIFKVVQKMFLMIHQRLFYVTCKDLVEDYDVEGHNGLDFLKKKKEYIIDDLDAEDKGKHYGKSTEIISSVISFRYELYQNTGIKTHFTTNSSLDDLEKRYGKREVERILHMCHLVQFPTNENKRNKTSGSPLKKGIDTRVQQHKESPAEAKQIANKSNIEKVMDVLFEYYKSLSTPMILYIDKYVMYDDLKKIGFFKLSDEYRAQVFIDNLPKAINSKKKELDKLKIKAATQRGLRDKYQSIKKDFEAVEDIKNRISDSMQVYKYITENELWKNDTIQECANLIKESEFDKWIEGIQEMEMDITEIILPKLKEYLNKNN